MEDRKKLDASSASKFNWEPGDLTPIDENPLPPSDTFRDGNTKGRGDLDERVARLNTPEECEQFAINVEARLPELARDARRRAVEFRAAAHGTTVAAEREALEAVYAYERVLSEKRGKRIRASRTWQMIKNHGIVGAVERAVRRNDDPAGYTALVEMGMEDLAFEAVVIRHPDVFSPEAVSRSTERLAAWKRKSD